MRGAVRTSMNARQMLHRVAASAKLVSTPEADSNVLIQTVLKATRLKVVKPPLKGVN